MLHNFHRRHLRTASPSVILSSILALSRSKSMAHHHTPCSSVKHHYTQFSNARFLIPLPRRHSTIWVCQICSRIPRGRRFQLKSSNGYPEKVASFQDGSIPLAKELREPPLKERSSPSPSLSSGKAESTLSITVIGASGDLAKKKIFPALFALFYEDCLPENFTVFGYARSKMTDEKLREVISRTLTCRVDKRENCNDKMDQFLERCFYHSGQYNSEDDFSEFDRKLKEKETGRLPYRLFYLSIPPNIFVDVAKCASLRASSMNGWTRVIVEKPFGRDSESSRELTRCLKQYLREDQIFRIDHYLGKELVENLSVLRFSNLVFEPLWCRTYIRNVQLIFSEDFGTEGRGGYFDNYGIIRDIMQNHLVQILALFAMETPVSLDAEDIRNEKVGIAARFCIPNREAIQYILSTCLLIEEHALSSPSAFSILQHEIVLSMQPVATEMANGSHLLRHYKKMEGECHVIWIPEDEQIHCSKEFEHSGFLYTHSFRVLAIKTIFSFRKSTFCTTGN